MKILHTSDWHLGHMLYGYDRAEEQMSMLLQMEDIVRCEQPDAFLLSGDVYHTSQPSSAVQTMFANALVKIHNANPDMTIVVTAGNHDSGSKHEIFRTPWLAMNVHAVGSVDENYLEDLIVQVPGKGYVIAVPYVNERSMPKDIYQRLLDNVKARNEKNLPVVMMAHTTVSGCDFAGHDNATEYTAGGIDTCNLADMGEGYDYLALGHIHRKQFVRGGNHRVRYCGTPLAVSFDEACEHTVSVVEIQVHGGSPVVTEKEIVTHRPVVTLPPEGDATWNDALQMLKNFPDDIEAYIRLRVVTENFLPAEANHEALAACDGKKCRFCVINVRRTVRKEGESKRLTIEEFKTEKPIDVVKRYAEDIGVTFDDDMDELFREACRLVDIDDRR